MAVSATGSGKTVVLTDIMREEPGASVAIAHRQELVCQIASGLAANGVRHRLVGASKGSPLIRVLSAVQTARFGYSHYDPNARVGVAGVDTLVRMSDDAWFKQVRLCVQDEAHHVLKKNKWGKAATLFPNARGLYPTATPLRADGCGLGRWNDGLMDVMVQAPSMRAMIEMGYLTDYRIICPQSTGLDLSNVPIGESGEFVNEKLREAVKKSSVVGDVVSTYLQYARGKLGVTFAVDVEEATKIAAAFRAAGVPAEVVSAKTPDTLRAQILRRFEAREVLQLVNVDLFGEGFDLPAIECVSFARPTASFALYCQQFGRALRLMIEQALHKIWGTLTDHERKWHIAQSSKPKAIVFDHVNNIIRHNGPPDRERVWSLERRERKAKSQSDAVPYTVCTGPNCYQPYPRTMRNCPHCGFYREPAARNGPEFVDGDMLELDEATLARMRGAIAKIDGDFYAPSNLSGPAVIAARRNHENRQEAQRKLRNSIAWWAGLWHAQGYSESQSYRLFYFTFGIDVGNCQTLGSPEAKELTDRINLELLKYSIDGNISSTLYFKDQNQ